MLSSNTLCQPKLITAWQAPASDAFKKLYFQITDHSLAGVQITDHSVAGVQITDHSLAGASMIMLFGKLNCRHPSTPE
jgi:hypothetical protein